MIRVVLPTGIAKQFTGGVTEVDAEGGNVRALIEDLGNRYPGLGRVLSEQMAVAIDGEIIQDPLLETVDENSEVYFLMQISGG